MITGKCRYELRLSSSMPRVSKQSLLQSNWQTCVPEILSLIFISGFSLRWPRDIKTPLIRVCSSWRKAALATSQLWATIAVEIADLNKESADSLAWWLVRTKRTDVKLKVKLEGDFEEEERGLNVREQHRRRIRDFEALLFARAHSWLRLELKWLPENVIYDILQPKLLARAVHLKRLLIQRFEGELARKIGEVDMEPVFLPNLTALELEAVAVSMLPKLFTPQLTSLSLNMCADLAPAELMDLVTNMPSLEKLTLDESAIFLAESSLEGIIFPFPALKSLSISHDYEVPQAFLEAMCRDAPLLKTLSASFGDLELSNREAKVCFPFRRIKNMRHGNNWGWIVERSLQLEELFTSFMNVDEFPTFPSALRRLKLELQTFNDDDDPSFTAPDLIRIFNGLPQLEILTIKWDHWRQSRCISFTPFLHALTTKTQNGSLICPRLHALDLYCVDIDDKALLEVSKLHSDVVGDSYSAAELLDYDFDMEFTVTLDGCFLLPEVENVTYEELVDILAWPDTIVPPYNPAR